MPLPHLPQFELLLRFLFQDSPLRAIAHNAHHENSSGCERICIVSASIFKLDMG